jgi:predicted dienelactone hydrolase
MIGMETMKKKFAVVASVCVLAGGGYFAASKWAIRHETLNLFDAARQRPVAVDIAVRRDYERKANDGYWKLPVAVISNGIPSRTPSIHSWPMSSRQGAIWLPAFSRTFRPIRH